VAKDGLPTNGVICGEFPADRIPREHHLALWRRVCTGECEVIPLTEDWLFRDDIKSCALCDVLITRQAMCATRYERTSRHVQRSGDAWIVLWYLRGGNLSTVFDDRTHLRLEPGSLCVLDWSVPHVAVATDYELVTVAFPRSQVPAAELMGSRTPAVTWAPGSAQGEILGNALEHLLSQLPQLDRNAAAALAAGFTGLVGGLLIAEGELLRNRYAETSRADAMKQFVNEHLRDPSLGVQTLCERFHCSRATVYRLFEAEGGVASHIQRQRLHACMRELTRIQSPPKGVLEQVASAWGFTNPHRFSRLFRAQFGLSPQEALRARTPRGRKQPAMRNEQDYWQYAEVLNGWIASRRRR
jgi:AraC-like DNA-binding protein